MSEENDGSKAGFFLAGLGIGAVIALLFAPRSGKETRDMIVQKAEEGRDFVKTKSEEIRKQAEDAVEKGKDLGQQTEGTAFGRVGSRQASVPGRKDQSEVERLRRLSLM